MILLIILVSIFTGCQSVELEEGGAYSDVVLYQADTALDNTVSTMEQFQKWAARNPLYLAQNMRARAMLDKVNQELDGIAEPDEILVQAVMARDLYATTISDRNLENLNDKLMMVNTLAQALLPLLFPDGEI